MKLKYIFALLFLFRIILLPTEVIASPKPYGYAVYVDNDSDVYISLGHTIVHKAETSANIKCQRASFAKGCRLLSSGNQRYVGVTKEAILTKFQYKGEVLAAGSNSSTKKLQSKLTSLCKKKKLQCKMRRIYDQKARKEILFFDGSDRFVEDPPEVYY